MGRRLPASLHLGRHVRRPVRAAVIVSMVVHAGLGLGLLRRQARAPAPPADSIEVDFTVTDAPLLSSAPAVDPVAQESPRPSAATPKAEAGQGPRAPKLGGQRGLSKPLAAASGAGEAPSESVPPSAGAVDPSGQGASDPFASFRPRAPDFSRVPLPPGAEAKRDLLAAPRLPDKAPGELARTLRGPAGGTVHIEEDGQIHFTDPQSVAADRHPFAKGEMRFLGLGGPFEMTDMLMRAVGQDPYAAGKRKIADETREQRLCMARRAQHAREAQALFELSTNVRAIAGRKDWSPEKRRRALFDIWDECEDNSDYAAMAQATIAAIIRQAFPEGSPMAYQPQELLALNERRTSRNKFAPYLVQEARVHTSRADHCRPPDAGLPIE